MVSNVHCCSLTGLYRRPRSLPAFTLQVATPADGSLLLPGSRGRDPFMLEVLSADASVILPCLCSTDLHLPPAAPSVSPLSDVGVLGQWPVGAYSSTRTADHHTPSCPDLLCTMR